MPSRVNGKGGTDARRHGLLSLQRRSINRLTSFRGVLNPV